MWLNDSIERKRMALRPIIAEQDLHKYIGKKKTIQRNWIGEPRIHRRRKILRANRGSSVVLNMSG